MAEKIVTFENKVKEIETKESEGIEMKEAPKQIEKCEKVSKKKEKKSKPNDSVFKFGAEARKTVWDQNKEKEEEKSQSILNVKFVTISVRNW